MADFKVSQNSGESSYNVKLSAGNSFTVTQEKTVAADLLSDLADVDVAGVGDKFVLMYNATTGKYTAVNPDNVLSASSNTETTQPGLPNDFINTLDTDLDDKIDLDAGTF